MLTTGQFSRDPSILGISPLPDNVHVERWVSHEDLLPRCAALVTTGGAATVLASLKAGVPLLVVPTFWDKSDNAQRVVEAGVGLRLAPRRCTPDGLRIAVRRLVEEPMFRENAQRMARRFAEAPGPAGAAALLEKIAGVSQPSASAAFTDRPRVCHTTNNAPQAKGNPTDVRHESSHSRQRAF